MLLKIICIQFVFFSTSFALNQLDTVIVTADRAETQLSEVTSSTVIIDSEEIESKYQGSVIKALRSVSGIELYSKGGLGRNTSLFLRGGSSQHVLVLIDGVKVNDSIAPGRAFDFARLNSTGVERIEVVKGAQSVLYGSDALAGVVNIITTRGSKLVQKKINIEYGSFETKRIGLNYNGSSNKWLLSSFVNLVHNEGYSVISDPSSSENDGHAQADINLNLDRKVSKQTDLRLGLRQTLSRTELDDFSKDDPNLEERTSQTTLNTSIKHKLSKDKKIIFNLDYNSIERQNIDLPNTSDPTDKKDFFKGQSAQAKLQYAKRYLKKNSFLIGLDYEFERGETNLIEKSEAHIAGVFVQSKSHWGDFINNMGLRYDKYSRGDIDAVTFRYAPGYIMKSTQTKLRASIASGFKVPSLYNLFDPMSGNADLEPEKSINYEVGFEQELFGGYTQISSIYYVTEYKDLFFFDPMNNFRAINLGAARVEGVELDIKNSIGDLLNIDLSYNYLFKAKDRTTDLDLVGRAKNSWSLNVSYQVTRNLFTSINFRYQGSRFNFLGDKLSGFERLDLSTKYELDLKTNFYLNIENLFNDKTQQVDGFNEPGFAVFIGANRKF